ncbi:sensor domain-containing diguanylate cyclase [Devosia soli]|uniref:sensor domain-containing diguanylate cyclase n=1 Tax=Devosia soli TaxID=361041 RepID=UPI001379321C|nr:sensor domain-containing diguanylate cyclase [Devosia soli]
MSHVRQLAACAGVGLLEAGRWIAHEGVLPCSDPVPSLFHDSAKVFPQGEQSFAPFLLIVPIPTIEEDRPLCLVLWDTRPRSENSSYILLARIIELAGQFAMAARREAERHRQCLLERASATARIGIWSCSLPDGRLTWTNGVYDLFELPRNSHIDRDTTLKMYSPESARQMQALRAEAIATCGDFNFDAQIITAKGNPRWMRITATVDGVEGVARRIFGMKQNITEEKHMAERMRFLAQTDVLTGLANRSLFNAWIEDLHGQRNGVPVGALILIDLDNFKAVNDTLGHVHGDTCLIKTGERLRQCAPPGALVARIGGDEFAILTDSRDSVEMERISKTIIDAFGHPVQLGTHQHRIGVSLGIAMRKGQDADTLYRDADAALYAAKSAGRGTWRLFNAA